MPPGGIDNSNEQQRAACARSALQARKHTAASGNDASAPSSTAHIQQACHGMKREARNRGCQAANSPLASNDTGDMAPSLHTARKPLSYHSTTVRAFARTPLSPIGPVQASRPPHFDIRNRQSRRSHPPCCPGQQVVLNRNSANSRRSCARWEAPIDKMMARSSADARKTGIRFMAHRVAQSSQLRPLDGDQELGDLDHRRDGEEQGSWNDTRVRLWAQVRLLTCRREETEQNISIS